MKERTWLSARGTEFTVTKASAVATRLVTTTKTSYHSIGKLGCLVCLFGGHVLTTRRGWRASPNTSPNEI